jgi:hypothetical protein
MPTLDGTKNRVVFDLVSIFCHILVRKKLRKYADAHQFGKM